MKLIPHIDIIEPERIQAALSDPQNYFWRAVDSEVLGDWQPDMGLSSYANYSIFRAPGAAKSGKPSTLRHRFWSTVEQQTDHRGWRYIGVVLYDTAGEECPMEFRLASEEIGRVEPTRHDNRLHLIVIDQPVQFFGEMEILQMTAPGAGQYRIEHFVLLRERPEASSFAPQIERLSAERAEDGAVMVHFITSQVARCTAEAFAEGEGAATACADEEALHTVHALRLDGLRPQRTYEIRVTATEKAGESSTAVLRLPAAGPLPAAEAFSVPLTLFAGADMAGMPLTFGVPLPEGKVYRPNGLKLEANGQAVSAQGRILSRWPDHSAKWLLVDAAVPVGTVASPHAGAAVLHANGPAEGQAQGQSINITETAGGGLMVENYCLRVTLQKEASWLRVEQQHHSTWATALSEVSLHGALEDGRVLSGGVPTILRVEETGSRRAAVLVELPITDEAGVVHINCRLRLHIYAEQPVIRFVQRLEVVSPELPAPARGDESQGMLRVRFLEMRAGGWHSQQVGVTRLVQEHDQAYRLITPMETEVITGRAAGHVTVRGQAGTLAAGLRHFWQTYPRGIRTEPDQLVFELLPALSGDPLPGDEDAWHRIYFWIKDGIYLLKVGLALRTEGILAFLKEQDGASGPWYDWLEEPPVARPEPAYTNSAGVLLPFASKADSPMPVYEALMERALEAFHADREYVRAYGQLNFGDWYGESGWSWGNNEYDPPYCSYLEFLRGGDPAWARLGEVAANHLVDVDTINFSPDSPQIGMQAQHMPGHLGGYLPPLFHSKVEFTAALPSHTWVEGPLLRYLLSGDEFIRESILKTRDWLMQNHWFDYYDFYNARESGWHILHLCMLANVTNDRRCLNAAAVIVRRLREREDPAGGWVHMLTLAHCGCGYPRCRGEAGFMVGVLLSALARFVMLTGDTEAKRMMIGGARWLVRNTYDAKSGYFHYTSCENRTLGGEFQKTQWVLEGLADAYALSGDEEIGWYLRDGLKVIGMFPKGVDHLGLGKAMSQQMRYVPAILAHLKTMNLDAIGDLPPAPSLHGEAI